MTAARAGNIAVMKLLLDRGADVNARENYKGQTALMWAAAERHPDVVKLLLEHGADWKVRSFDRETKLPKLERGLLDFSRSPAEDLPLSCSPPAKAISSPPRPCSMPASISITATSTTPPPWSSLIMNKQYTFAKFCWIDGADPNLADANGRAALYAAVDIRNEDWSTLPSARPTIRCRASRS